MTRESSSSRPCRLLEGLCTFGHTHARTKYLSTPRVSSFSNRPLAIIAPITSCHYDKFDTPTKPGRKLLPCSGATSGRSPPQVGHLQYAHLITCVHTTKKAVARLSIQRQTQIASTLAELCNIRSHEVPRRSEPSLPPLSTSWQSTKPFGDERPVPACGWLSCPCDSHGTHTPCHP
jgi:hypothetical protein